MAEPIQPLDPQRIVTTLARHRVRYVLIGGLAARLHGLPRLPTWAVISPAGDGANLIGLAAALRSLDAKIGTEGVPEGLAFECTAKTLSRSDTWKLVTTAGRLDLDFKPAGMEGYDALAIGAVRFDVFGVPLMVASRRDLVRAMEVSDRAGARRDILVMRGIARRT